MHSKERQQLVELYSREARRSLAPPKRGSSKSASLLALMLKCAACVAVVTLLVVISNGEYNGGRREWTQRSGPLGHGQHVVPHCCGPQGTLRRPPRTL